jgi:hypothetical protein
VKAAKNLREMVNGMPKCVDCSEYVAKLEWCKARMIHLSPQIVNKDLPCSDFKLKKFGTYAVQEIKPAIKQAKNKPVHKEQTVEFDFPFFPYWLSRYILGSIKQCGDMSLAYDLLIKDATPDLKRRLRIRG